MFFSQSITCLDWCLESEEYPVVRIFGTTPSGQTSMIHLHGAFPYFYCDFPSPLPLAGSVQEQDFFYEVRECILTRLKKESGAIHQILRADHKISIYGYHKPISFCKIELTDPSDMKLASECLVMDKRLRVYESHVGFIPQVMCDLDLYGMDLITCKEYAFRFPMPLRPVIEEEEEANAVFWCESMQPPPIIHYAPAILPNNNSDNDQAESIHAHVVRPARSSNCELELDIYVKDVVITKLQQQQCNVSSRNINFVKSFVPWWDAEEERRRLLGLRFEGDMEKENPNATFQCPDPFNYRSRLRDGIQYSTQAPPPPQTQECGTPQSQDTLEIIRLLEEMKQTSSRAKPPEVCPSQMSDEELLMDAPQPPATTRAALQAMEKRDHSVAWKDSEASDDEEEEEEQGVGSTWRDICQSQKQFLNEIEQDEDSVVATMTTPHKSQSQQTPKKLGVDLFYGDYRDDKTQQFTQVQSPTPLETSWFQPRNRTAPVPATKKRRPPPVGMSQLSMADTATQSHKSRAVLTALQRDIQNTHPILSILSIECFSRTTSSLLPNPEVDPVTAVFYSWQACFDEQPSECGMIYVANSPLPEHHMLESAVQACVPTERALLHDFLLLVQKKNPDVFMAWELQKESLGFILKRAKALKLPSYSRQLSRVPFGPQDPRHEQASIFEEHSGFWIPGRIIINLWRLARHDLKLSMYSLTSVLLHTLGEKFPAYTQQEMNEWHDSPFEHKRTLFAHYLQRSKASLLIARHLDVFGRGTELCRFLGFDLFSSLTRGSQYQVESLIKRVSVGGGENGASYILLSPTRAQVAAQKSMDSCPLIFEPQSQFCVHPVCVFDFRSLYPSVIIANNICYSTCLGRINLHGDNAEDQVFLPGLGVDRMNESSQFSRKDIGFVSPNGVCFLSKEKRVGILPRMLDEILKTRRMVKESIAGEETNAQRKRLIEARQYGLKMIANLTYGYTAASFTGRMPCVEVAETIVETGRAALEFAVAEVSAMQSTTTVVYGDTDSMFVHLVGRNLNEARRLGKDISSRISSKFPRPIKLQFEKIYFPCVLQVKKRYVGFKFPPTTPRSGALEERGVLDAKGIETVTRSGCPALVKTMEAMLKELFTSRDLFRVKTLLLRQLSRMSQGTISLSDFILTGKVKFGSYAKDLKQTGNYPPAAVVGDKLFQRDAQAKPLYKQRIQYLVACGPPHSRLVDLVVDPLQLVDENLRVNVAHYIFKLILPAVRRILQCCINGEELESWFVDLEKTKNQWGGFRRRTWGGEMGISKVFSTCAACVLCGNSTVESNVLCVTCGKDLQQARATGEYLTLQAEITARQCLWTCATCILRGSMPRSNSQARMLGDNSCVNLDCEDFYSRKRAMTRMELDVPTFEQIGM